jgi:hypothetical protein
LGSAHSNGANVAQVCANSFSEWKVCEMCSFRNSAVAWLIAFSCALVSCVPARAADKKDKEPIPQMKFDASVDRVYAAEVQSVGATLKAAVKEACMVNFQTRYVSGNFYRLISYTAVCKDAGNGKTTVTLSCQVQSNLFGDGGVIKRTSDTFWSNMDAALKNSSGASGAPKAPPEAAHTSTDVPAVVQVSSEPSGADITVDSDYEGNTPSQLKLKPGPHSVKIIKKGFEPWERSINVEAGDTRNISASLEKSNQ